MAHQVVLTDDPPSTSWTWSPSRIAQSCLPSPRRPSPTVARAAGACAAIIADNADPGTATDTINLNPGTYSLTLQNPGGVQENAAATGDLDITSTAHTLIIKGQGTSGPSATIIDASALLDRVFQIVKPGTQVELDGLVIKGGLAQDDGTAGVTAGSTTAEGGGILNNGGTLTLNNVVLDSDTALGGAGAAGGADAAGSAGQERSAAACPPAAGRSRSPTPPSPTTKPRAATVTSFGRRRRQRRPGGRPVLQRRAGHAHQLHPLQRPAQGGNGGGSSQRHRRGSAGGVSQGGGLSSSGGSVTLTNSTLSNDLAQGGNGGAGGAGVSAGGDTSGGGLASQRRGGSRSYRPPTVRQRTYAPMVSQRAAPAKTAPDGRRASPRMRGTSRLTARTSGIRRCALKTHPVCPILRLHATRLRTSLSTAPAITPVNRNGPGGGLSSSFGSVTLTNSTLSNNLARASSGSGGIGGGIFMFGGGDGERQHLHRQLRQLRRRPHLRLRTVRVSDSTFTSNSAGTSAAASTTSGRRR